MDFWRDARSVPPGGAGTQFRPPVDFGAKAAYQRTAFLASAHTLGIANLPVEEKTRTVGGARGGTPHNRGRERVWRCDHTAMVAAHSGLDPPELEKGIDRDPDDPTVLKQVNFGSGRFGRWAAEPRHFVLCRRERCMKRRGRDLGADM